MKRQNESTKDPFNGYLDGLRREARTRAFNAEKLKIERRRKAERRLKKEGASRPFATLNLADVERIKRSGEYDDLIGNEDFRARVQALEQEMSEALDAIQDAEDEAIQRAIVNLPDDVRLAHEHERERNLFLLSADVEDAEKLPPATQEAFSELLRKQRQELESVQ